jgi:hypothetical protein
MRRGDKKVNLSVHLGESEDSPLRKTKQGKSKTKGK